MPCLAILSSLAIRVSNRQVAALLNQLARQWQEEFDLLCVLLANSLVVHTEETGWPWLRCGR